MQGFGLLALHSIFKSPLCTSLKMYPRVVNLIQSKLCALLSDVCYGQPEFSFSELNENSVYRCLVSLYYLGTLIRCCLVGCSATSSISMLSPHYHLIIYCFYCRTLGPTQGTAVCAGVELSIWGMSK